MITEKLNFEDIGTNPPKMTCNCCGKTDDATGWLMATIYPFMDRSSNYSVVVCSDKCKDDFLSHPASNLYVLEAICKISFQAGGLTYEYAQIADEHNAQVDKNNFQ